MKICTSLLSVFLLLFLVPMGGCFLPDDSCDDCSGVAGQTIRFRIVSKDGKDLFFAKDNDQFSTRFLKITSIDDNGQIINEVINNTDSHFFVDLQIGLSNRFTVKYNNFEDTLEVKAKDLSSSCPQCPLMEITELKYNNEVICQSCGGILVFTSSM